MILSIVIPVYNVEKYIEKCLLSCIEQNISLESYEIIVVIDGSPDNSLVIAKRIANTYMNIRIINQENQGLSGARNVGMKYAKGKYIWFIDSDDYIEKNCLSRIISNITNDLDILQLQYRYVYENGSPSVDGEIFQIEGVKTGIEIIKDGGLPVPIQFSIFRTGFLREHKLEFMLGIYHEDSEFKPKATYLAKKISSDPEICYNYLQRLSGSITSHFKLKNGLDILKVNNSLLDFMEEQNMPNNYRRCLYSQIGMNINTLLYGMRQLSEHEKVNLIQHIIVNKHMFSYMIKSDKVKYRIEGLIFKFNINIGLFLHRYIR